MRELVEYFRSLELALSKHREKLMPKGDPRTAGYIPDSPETLGISVWDGMRFERAAKSCG